MLTILKKEIKAYFSTPFGFIFMGIFLLMSGIAFTTYNLLGRRADIYGMLGIMRTLSITAFPVLTMRLLAEVGTVCRRLIILNRGRIAAMDTTENLASGVTDPGRFLLTLKAAPAEAERTLGSVGGILGFKPVQNARQLERGYCSFVVENRKDSNVRELLFEALAGKAIPIIELRSLGRTLEDAFLELTEEGARQGIGP